MKLNQNYGNLKDSYLFATVNRKVREYAETHPEADIIKLGIGDVTLPICQAAVDAMRAAAAELGCKETFKGYPDYEGYAFLREAISAYYKSHGVKVPADDVFVSDGAKSDCGNIIDIFSPENTVVIPDPVYPVYLDTNIMLGSSIVYINGCEENGFLPMPDRNVKADMIYLCSPNNPTGAAYDRAQLTEWVAYANDCDAVILFDAAYEAFVSDVGCPRSIYEIDGAKTCAIEFCSFSKTAGFTGVRCGYTVIPSELVRDGISLKKMWLRRQSTRFNGVSYVVQRGAAAVLTDEGMTQACKNIAYYKTNAAVIASALDAVGVQYFGGKNSPYIWLKCPNSMNSWDFFDTLLTRANIVGTPGEGFGKMGENYFRLTAFGDKERTKEASDRLKKLIAAL